MACQDLCYDENFAVDESLHSENALGNGVKMSQEEFTWHLLREKWNRPISSLIAKLRHLQGCELLKCRHGGVVELPLLDQDVCVNSPRHISIIRKLISDRDFLWVVFPGRMIISARQRSPSGAIWPPITSNTLPPHKLISR